jgi:hypothetical protein
VLVAVFALVVVNADADGDPASDVLVSQRAFIPADASVSAAEQAHLQSVLGAAAERGYPIRVALIASAADLGSITALWRRPQTYAHYLGLELSFAVHGPVLVVMPDGAGLYTGDRLSAAERTALSRARAGVSGRDLAPLAAAAVGQLAAAAGHPLPRSSMQGSAGAGAHRTRADTVAWIVFAAGAALIAIAWSVSLRVRPPRRRGERPSSA